MVIVITLEMPVFEGLNCIVTKGNLHSVGLGKKKKKLCGSLCVQSARLSDIEGAFESPVKKTAEKIGCESRRNHLSGVCLQRTGLI